MSRLAVVQTPPVFLDRKQTLAKAVASVREAAQEDPGHEPGGPVGSGSW